LLERKLVLRGIFLADQTPIAAGVAGKAFEEIILRTGFERAGCADDPSKLEFAVLESD
jgi:hypothetical protein